jgi:L-ascorbate metabolism protein UlaG (beta-lactamase superfamily)
VATLRDGVTVTGPDAAPAEGAAVDLRFVGHATVLLQLGGLRILTDPFLRHRLGPLERHGPTPEPDALGEVDLVLISHGHRDHFDRASLEAISGNPTIVVPQGLGTMAHRWRRGEVVELTAGQEAVIGGVAVRAVPARHWITPGAPRAQPQGYVIDAGRKIWFAGDTGRFPALSRLRGSVDVALLPVWTWGPHLGPGHLGPRSAAQVLADVGASIAVPIHWGTLYPRRLHRVWRSPLTEPGDRFAAYAAGTAPAADVRVLRPGETTSISD